MDVQFAEFTKPEKLAVAHILSRATAIVAEWGDTLDPQSLEMDIAAVHQHTPLRLRELARADRFNFIHDVFGIRRHIDRETGRLTDHFLPRYAK